jgi:glycosyltransferase involved in cell wall biosynthesis
MLAVARKSDERVLPGRLSIIIPTRNRVRSLKKLLDSLAAAVSPAGTTIEIIVINNASTDATRTLLEDEAAKPRAQSLTVLDEPRTGKSNAVNRALSVVRGDIIMILDDDVSIDSHCLVKHLEAYRKTSFAAIQGRIFPGKDPDGRSANPEWLRQYNIPLIDHGDEMTAIRGLTGTNMSFKREVLERVGLFDTRLGPGAAGFSEDTEFSARIREAGFEIGYTPEAIVYHELDPGRYGRAYNRNVEFRKGLSRSIYRRDSVVFRIVPDLVVNCLRYVIYRLLGRTQKAFKAEGRLMKSWGYLIGRLRRRTSIRTPG